MKQDFVDTTSMSHARRKKQHSETRSFSREGQQKRLELSGLPDEMLVRIGTSVAKLCGISDFVALSMASKRWKRLLIDSQATIQQVIRIRTTTPKINKFGRIEQTLLPPSLNICTLQQLVFYESVVKAGFFQENRVHFDFADLKVADDDSIELIHAARSILQQFPSASIILEAHCGTPAPAEISWLYSHYRGRVVSTAIVRGTQVLDLDPLEEADTNSTSSLDLQGRVSIRAWGKMITKVVAQSKDHPYGDLAREGRGWVEIFLRMEDANNNENNENTLELPHRPDFYNQATAMPMPREYQIEDR